MKAPSANGWATPGHDRPPADAPAPAAPFAFQAAFDYVFDSRLVTDVRGVILEANAAAADLLQCRQQFLVGKPLGLFAAGPDRQRFYDYLTRLRDGSDPGVVRVWAGVPGAGRRELLLAATPSSHPGHFRWVLHDLTTTRKVERDLSDERELLLGVVDAADAAILMTDLAGRIVRSNAYIHRLSGYPAAGLSGREWCGALLVPEDRTAGRWLLAQAANYGMARSGPLGLQAHGGAVRSVAWTARGLRDTSPGVVLIGHDVTELEEAQVQGLRTERLAAIGQVMAGLAHESRNALQRGQSCLSLLALRLADRPDVADLVARTQKAQDDLHHLYEGVLHYAAPVRLERAPCDLAAVWREAWADVTGGPGGPPAELVEEPDGETECRADPFQMKRVFVNLFDNARAAVSGPLRVTVQSSPTELAGRPALRVSVRDNGPGFPPAARDWLFEAFYTTKTHGTGLGLALCKRVVEAHGGQIEAGTGPLPGAEVMITLPRSPS